MHESLRLSKLSRLPLRLRVLAERAVREPYTLEPLVNRLAANPHRALLLPVFYVNLAVDDMPAPPDEDVVESQQFRARVARALLAVQALNDIALDVPPGAVDDLWPRYWAWVQFLDVYNRHWRIPPVEHPAGLSSDWLVLIQHLAEICHKMKKTTISDTPGLRTMLTQLWTHFVRAPSGVKRASALYVISRIFTLLFKCKVDAQIVLAELSEGVGGNLALARLCVQHLRSSFPDGNQPASEPRLIEAIFLIDLIPAVNPFIQRELHEQGIVTALTTTCLSISQMENTIGDEDHGESMLLNGFLFALSRSLAVRNAEVYLAEAVRAGLMRLAVVSKFRGAHAAAHYLVDLVGFILPPFTIYPAVLSAADAALADVSKAYAHTPLDPDARLAFEKLDSIVSFRRRALLVYRTNAHPAMAQQACSNPRCQVIAERHQLKRCSLCRAQFYCSKLCQKADWRSNGHRQTCSRLAKPSPSNALGRPRDRAFVSALLLKDYLAQRDKIAQEILRAFRMNPHAQLYVSWSYNYEEWLSTLDFTPHATAVVEDTTDTAFHGFYDTSPALRAAYEGGTVVLHVFNPRFPSHAPSAMDPPQFPFPARSNQYLLLLRSPSGALMRGLRQLGAQPALDWTMCEEQIQELLKEDGIQAFSCGSFFSALLEPRVV
ncbi:MYND-type domain-containing protein [Mycena indigotica]|uniref:phytol kinase n=1 Tax=Mycena indigotica TaxID=2126181 RepID=A0A8H6SQ66_9AGAR|nr:MYND-type domain-containing protein [Mycena indigotica]KAF7303409.1 MYND-type domain-containing protein [Mycena indigotica]